MCFMLPLLLPLASFAIGAATSVMGYMNQSSAANAQQAYQNQLRNQQKQLADLETAKYLQEAEAMRFKEAQEKEQQGRDIFNITQEAKAAKSRAIVAAGEAGVGGASVDAILADFGRQETAYAQAVRRQGFYSEAATNRSIENARLGTQYNVTALQTPMPPIQKPNLWATALQIGSQGLDSYGQYMRYAPGKSPTAKV